MGTIVQGLWESSGMGEPEWDDQELGRLPRHDVSRVSREVLPEGGQVTQVQVTKVRGPKPWPRRCSWLTGWVLTRLCGRPAYQREVDAWFCNAHWLMVRRRLDDEERRK